MRSRGIPASSETISGSVEVSSYYIKEFLKSLNLKEDEIKAFYQYLVNSGIAIYRGYGDYIIPVSCLLDNVLKVFEEGVKGIKAVEVKARELRLF
jgi:hypothetical protein